MHEGNDGGEERCGTGSNDDGRGGSSNDGANRTQ